MRIMAVAMVLFFLGGAVVSAQSMLEYATLSSATGAAGAAGGEEKDKDKKALRPGGLTGSMATRLYDQSMQTAAQRSASLFGRLGHDMPAPPSAFVPAKEGQAAAPAASAVQEPPDRVSAEEIPESGLTAIVLKNGMVVEGNLVEQTPGTVRIESAGVVVTFFADEIDRVRPADEGP